MATSQEVAVAVHALVARVAEVDRAVRVRFIVERTVSCHVSDLGVLWSARLCQDGLCDVADTGDDRAQVRFAVGSDDLLALADGRLLVAVAWAAGRLKVQASPLDLLRLRALL